MDKTKQLRRSGTNFVIAGVCGGFAEYFEIDPTIVRIIFIILALASGSGILIYLILWIVIPGPTTTHTETKDIVRENVTEMGNKIEELAHSVEDGFNSTATSQNPVVQKSGQHWLGIVLVILGAWFLFSNLGFLHWVRMDLFWPIVLIFVGILFINRNK